MPCYITGSRDGDLELDIQELSKEATKLNRLLCEVCQWVEDGGRGLPGTVAKWWFNHQKIDAMRKARAEKDRELKKIAAKREIKRLKKILEEA